MKRKTLYNFNSVQLTFNQCVSNRIQYRTEHNMYSTRLDNSTGNSALQFSLQFGPYNSAYNSYLQFRLTNSYLQIRLTIGLTILVDQNGWNDPSVRTATLRGPKRLSRASRPSLADVSRIGRSNGKVTRGKDSFSWHFSVDRFPLWTYPRGPPRPQWTQNCWCGWFYTYSRRLTHVYLRVRVYLRAMHFYSRDYFANFLRLKVLNF